MMTFSDYQREALRTDRTGDNDLKGMMIPLLGLAGEAGSLLSEYKKWLREGEAYVPFSHQVSEEIGDILWYLAKLASRLNLDLGDIAAENLAKIQERWPLSEGTLFSTYRYDSAFPPHERLPVELRVEFIEESFPTGSKLILKCNGKRVGDPLTDNSHINDGYRYHDVFHFGCAILLGWSPVVRRILSCKRKSVPRIDEVEDGARALVTEEGVSAVVFEQARDYSMFASTTSIDYGLLQTIKGMTRTFEVRSRSLGDWQTAILTIYPVFRKMIENRGGTLIGNANRQTIEYAPPSL